MVPDGEHQQTLVVGQIQPVLSEKVSFK